MEMNGYIIRSYMVKAGVTVLQIARQLGMRPPTVSQVIHGVRKNPRIREAIAAAINRPISELWPDTKTDQSKEAA
jgi:transcriptional regulator with XRE-family HTH domain